jgi:OFA family oxalate/formate antiporter-like MFS transporter
MVSTRVFWVLYLMFVMVATGGLVATANLASIAQDFRVADAPVRILGLSLPALTFALSIDRVLNGITRPFFGWVSDHLGRENTMFIAFSLEAVGILAFSQLGQEPVAFVLLSGLVFFAWGEVYSLFPAACRDIFGGRHAAANAGLLYTAKGTASLLVPIAGWVSVRTGEWSIVLVVASATNAIAALCALVVLKPLRIALRDRSAGAGSTAEPPWTGV